MAFADKVAIVAGGATGIGLATALRLAEGGARVAICSHDAASLGPALEQIRARGQAIALPADVAAASAMAELVERTVSTFGGVDHLVNSAGIQTYGTVVDTPEETWDRTLAVNLKGAYLAAKYAIPRMIERGGGAIVNVSSVQGSACQTNVAAYAASKGALNALTRAMALDHARERIRVNAVCPARSTPRCCATRPSCSKAPAASSEPSPTGAAPTRWGGSRAPPRSPRSSPFCSAIAPRS